MKAKTKNRWLRKWYDDYGELYAIIRENGRYYLRVTTPAFEPGAGSIEYISLSKQQAQETDYEDLERYDNHNAKEENDPFFNS